MSVNERNHWGSRNSRCVSAWDMITKAETGVTGLSITSETYCFLALAGGILVIVGALGALAFPKMKILIKTTLLEKALTETKICMTPFGDPNSNFAILA